MSGLNWSKEKQRRRIAHNSLDVKSDMDGMASDRAAQWIAKHGNWVKKTKAQQKAQKRAHRRRR